ncbi:MAG: hypothetical protein JWO85_2285 [Candidatus Eremiobacteraeota bacterium]|jgi:hypothetical protein|nr:hypothetical protein [Candidatus Eremiobacteraeota bacterium]
MKIAIVSAALLLLCVASCAHHDTYHGGVYTSFTMPPRLGGGPPEVFPTYSVTAAPRPVAPSATRLAFRIAADRAALRADPSTSGSGVGTRLVDLMDALWQARRIRDLNVLLAGIGERFHYSSDDSADAAFLRGDRFAGFEEYARGWDDLSRANVLAHRRKWREAIVLLRTVHDDNRPQGRDIKAALVEGDAYFACGRVAAARATWERAFQMPILQLPDTYAIMPEWTSAMRRLARYHRTPDRPSAASRCFGLPAAV